MDEIVESRILRLRTLQPPLRQDDEKIPFVLSQKDLRTINYDDTFGKIVTPEFNLVSFGGLTLTKFSTLPKKPSITFNPFFIGGKTNSADIMSIFQTLK